MTPRSWGPHTVGADLSALAGQTVRIRIANAVHENEFNAMVDNVSLTSAPILNTVARGKLKLNKRNGTAKLTITVPGPGTLVAVGKGKVKKLKRTTLTATGAGQVLLPLRPNGPGRKILEEKGKLKTKIAVTFSPAGGLPGTQYFKVILRRNID